MWFQKNLTYKGKIPLYTRKLYNILNLSHLLAKTESMVMAEAPFYFGQHNYRSHLCPERVFKTADSYPELVLQTHFFKSRPRLAGC